MKGRLGRPFFVVQSKGLRQVKHRTLVGAVGRIRTVLAAAGTGRLVDTFVTDELD